MLKTLKNILLIAFCLLFFQQVFPKHIQAYYSFSKFYLPNGDPYIETYILVNGESINLKKNTNQKYQGIAQILLMFKQNGQIIEFRKYDLNSPETTDSVILSTNFIDEQRIPLPAGKYSIELEISDKNSNGKPLLFSDSLIIEPLKNNVYISDIEPLESFRNTTSQNSFSKNGYDMFPYIINFYPRNVDKLTFYTEIYNTEKIFGNKEMYLIKYFIETYEKEIPIPNYILFKRETANSVNAILSEFAIESLPSGNYNLVIEIRDKQNNLITNRKFFFQRSNPNAKYDISQINAVNISNTFVDRITGRDTLIDFISCLGPISTGMEKSFIDRQLKGMDIKTLQQFFYNFWFTRNSVEPEKEWRTYYDKVLRVNTSFGCKFKKGYNTDRGRVYLQYGPPNTISESKSEPSSYPYEIWHYYTLNKQSNRKFVFYNTDLVSNDYELLHSDAIGEVYKSNWQLILQSRNTPMDNIDQTQGIDHYGSKAGELFDTPR
ncbi:MAG: GWxTD domain-containing protein [Bacteroidota bacterium]|nr:GWxTD domain-containing protein [Bacteroidota bacterium]